MSAKIIIVDEDDQIIGHKNRDEITSGDIYRSSSLWIINRQGEILLAQRALSKDHGPGMWGPAVEGTIERGETYESNMIKETGEELGLLNVKPIEKDKIRVAGKWNHFCQRFLLVLDRNAKDFAIDKAEVEQVRWFSKEELSAKMKENPRMFVASMEPFPDFV